MQAIYFEKQIEDHPRTQALFARYPDLPKIPCLRYNEVFNKKSQNFRLQKEAPSLILAKKTQKHILPTPSGYGIGGKKNYYFSHMLNCIYDCRYCFLQGMYRSANYVLFVNFEDFQDGIQNILDEEKEATFFSGYDCDSLALEPMTHFLDSFLPFFEKKPQATLELRTKSIQISTLLKQKPFDNCVVAYSLSPKEIQSKLEHRTPSLEKRLDAIEKLQNAGWKTGLRFDPIVYCENYEEVYSRFFEEVFSRISLKNLHSASLGVFRLPKEIFQNIYKLYPDEKLFSHSLVENGKMVSYSLSLERKIKDFCTGQILSFLPPSLLFTCEVS